MNNSGFYWLGGTGEEEISLNGKYEHEPEKELYFLVPVGPTPPSAQANEYLKKEVARDLYKNFDAIPCEFSRLNSKR